MSNIQDTKQAANSNKDIVETALAGDNLKTLSSALGKANLVETLKGPGPFTIFAPTDEAFAKLPKAELEALMEDKEKLKSVLLHHVITGKVMAADVGKMQDGTSVAAKDGNRVIVNKANGNITVGKSALIRFDIAASNGVIHVVDTVILN